MTTRSEVGIGVRPQHKLPLRSLVEDAFGEPDRVVDDELGYIVIYESVYWSKDNPDINKLLFWFDELPDDEWGWVEIFPGDEGPVIESNGSPYEFGLYYECKIVVEH